MEHFFFNRQYLFLIRQLTAREIKRKYARSYLGIFWSILNPLLSMTVLSLIFSQIFRRSIENYPIYYLTGYLLWQMFTTATNTSMTTITDNKMLLLKVKFPMELFIWARVYTAFMNLLYSLAAYGVMLIVFRISFKWTMLMAIPILFFLILFSLGMSYILSAAFVFFGDIKYLYSVFLTLWMYCSAIFYPAEQLQGIIRIIIENNPMYIFIHCMRKAVMFGQLPLPYESFEMIMWSVDLFFAGYIIFFLSRKKILQNL